MLNIGRTEFKNLLKAKRAAKRASIRSEHRRLTDVCVDRRLWGSKLGLRKRRILAQKWFGVTSNVGWD